MNYSADTIFENASKFPDPKFLIGLARHGWPTPWSGAGFQPSAPYCHTLFTDEEFGAWKLTIIRNLQGGNPNV